MAKLIIKKLLIISGLGLLLILYLKLGNIWHFYLFCPIYKITGLYCPGCGVTRMLLSILDGNFKQAFRYNPLLFIFMPFILGYFIEELVVSIQNKPSIIEKLEPYIWYVLIGIFGIYGILRNIPLFDFLKPTVLNLIMKA